MPSLRPVRLGGSSHITATKQIIPSDTIGRQYATGIAPRYNAVEAICLPQVACGGFTLCARTWLQSTE